MVRSPGAISKAGDDTLIRIGPPNHPVLEAEDTRGRLPTITDLATCQCAVGIVATVAGGERCTRKAFEIPAVAAIAVSAVPTDVVQL